MENINAYLEEHADCHLRLKRENSLWIAGIYKNSYSPQGKRISWGSGAKPSAALVDLERKIRMFAH